MSNICFLQFALKFKTEGVSIKGRINLKKKFYINCTTDKTVKKIIVTKYEYSYSFIYSYCFLKTEIKKKVVF